MATNKKLNSSWNTLFSNIEEQGVPFDEPVSSSNVYYAFLANIEYNYNNDKYDLFFEMVSQEWMQNTILFNDQLLKKPSLSPPPKSPAVLYGIQDAESSELIDALGVDKIDDIEEGAWYKLEFDVAPDGENLDESDSSLWGEIFDYEITND
ncbi:MAG: hypothetical protein QNK23_13850 [Crocinitomicaceae bacterium]|nr:hypothetical protein [Crocinitomicaceae bacterium]